MFNRHNHINDLHKAFNSKDKSTILSAISIAKNISISGYANLKPLHRAAEMGDIDIINALFDRGAWSDLHKMSVEKWTPLHYAIRKGHANAVKLLLQKGSSIDQVTNFDHTVLDLACASGDLDTVVTIYNAGGSKFVNQLNTSSLQELAQKAFKQNRFDFLDAIFNKIHPDELHKIINHEYTIDNKNYKQTFLFSVAEAGNVTAVRLLLEHQANPNLRCYYEYGKQKKSLAYITPLAVAVLKGHLAVVEYFFEHSMIDITEHDYKGKENSLKRQEHNSQSNKLSYTEHAFIHLLMQDKRVKKAIPGGAIPLVHLAIRRKDYPLLKLLLTKVGENELLRNTEKGMTALLLAIRLNDMTAVEMLTNDSTIINQTNDKHTPLILASAIAKSEIVTLLLQRGAAIELSNTAGVTPLIAAVSKNNMANVTLLLQAGSQVNVLTQKGNSPLMTAAIKGHADLLGLLVTWGADLTQNPNKLLDAACQSGNLATVKFFLERGFDINGRIENGYTPLLTATKYKHPLIVKTLIDAGADVNYQLSTFESAMSIAIENFDCQTFSLLIAADVKLEPIANSRLYDRLVEAAVTEHNKDILQLLIESGFRFDNLERTVSNTASFKAIFLAIKNDRRDTIRISTSLNVLLLAIQNNRSDIIRLLVAANADVNQVQKQSETAKIRRALQGYSYSSDSSDKDDTDEKSWGSQKYTLSPLHEAILADNFEVAETLVELDADVNQLISTDGPSPLHLLLSRYQDVENKRSLMQLLQLLIAKGANINHVRSLTKNSKIQDLSRYPTNSYDDSDEDETVYKDYYSLTLSPLHEAILTNNFEVAGTLIKLGADVNQLISTNGVSPLHIVLNRYEESAFEETIPRLLESLVAAGANVNQLCYVSEKDDYYGAPQFTSTPVYTAFKKNLLTAMALLLKAGAEAGIELIDLEGCEKPLIYLAAEQGNSKAVELLIQHAFLSLPSWIPAGGCYDEASVDEDIINYSDNTVHYGTNDNWYTTTPLHTAAEKGHKEVVKTLVKYHPDLCFIRDKQCLTAEEVAQKNRHHDLASYLKKMAVMIKENKHSNLLQRFSSKFFKPQTRREKPYTDIDILICNQNLKL